MANKNNPYLSGSLGSFIKTTINQVTPWNTGDEQATLRAQAAENAAQAAEDARKTMQLEADLELKKQAAGLIDSNQLAALGLGANTKTYIILGVVLVLVVGIAVYFKFRRK